MTTTESATPAAMSDHCSISHGRRPSRVVHSALLCFLLLFRVPSYSAPSQRRSIIHTCRAMHLIGSRLREKGSRTWRCDVGKLVAVALPCGQGISTRGVVSDACLTHCICRCAMAEFRTRVVWYGVSNGSCLGEYVKSSVRQYHDWYQGQHLRKFAGRSS